MGVGPEEGVGTHRVNYCSKTPIKSGVALFPTKRVANDKCRKALESQLS